MKAKSAMVIRYLLGAIFFIFGLNGFFHFIPLPPPASEAAGAYMGGLYGSGYFFPLLALTETAVGGMLLSGFFVPLALVILAPVTINIFLYHLSVDPAGIGMAIVVVAANAFLGWAYLASYAGVLQSKAVVEITQE
ncbi:MAG: acyltransferase [SAR324 cluster bacterium]|nr:acyltransferase [SAR324 cluster bacterium]